MRFFEQVAVLARRQQVDRLCIEPRCSIVCLVHALYDNELILVDVFLYEFFSGRRKVIWVWDTIVIQTVQVLYDLEGGLRRHESLESIAAPGLDGEETILRLKIRDASRH